MAHIVIVVGLVRWMKRKMSPKNLTTHELIEKLDQFLYDYSNSNNHKKYLKPSIKLLGRIRKELVNKFQANSHEQK